MIALSTLLLAALCVQEPNERVPVQSAPLEQLDSPPAPPRVLPADTELRLYEVGHLSGHVELKRLIDSMESSSDLSRLDLALDQFTMIDKRRVGADQTTEHLLSTIRKLIAPPLDPTLQGIQHLENGSIALVGLPAQHQWLSDFLQAADEFAGFIEVQAKVFKIEREQLSQLTDLRSGTVLSELAARALVEEIRRSEIEVVISPQMVVSPFQQGRLSIVRETSYVKDYELRYLSELEGEVADPVVDVLQSGVVLNLRAVPLVDNQLGIFVDLKLSELVEPIPTAEIVIGSDAREVTVQLPQLKKISVNGHFDVYSGEVVLLISPDPSNASDVMVLISTTKVDHAGLWPTRER